MGCYSYVQGITRSWHLRCFLLLADAVLKVRAQKKDITRTKYFRIKGRGGENGKNKVNTCQDWSSVLTQNPYGSCLRATFREHGAPEDWKGFCPTHRTQTCELELLHQCLHDMSWLDHPLNMLGRRCPGGKPWSKQPALSSGSKLFISFKCVSKSAVKSYTFPLFSYIKLYLRM